jgi:tetratricopeptide (TPR) repeat protein
MCQGRGTGGRGASSPGWPGTGVASAARRATARYGPWVLVGMVFLVVAVYVTWTRPALDRAAGLAAARDALATHDDTGAVVHLERVLQRHPGNGEAALLLARAERRRGNLPRAARMVDVARTGGALPELVDLEAALVRLRGHPAAGLAATGFHSDEARALRVAAATGHPESPEILMALIDAATGAFAMSEAHALASAWIERSPGDWLPRVRRGEIRARFSLHVQARDDYEAALAIDPTAAAAQAGLGTLLVRHLGDAAAAEPHLVAAIDRRPDDTDCLTALAEARLRTARPEAARAVLARVLATHPDDAAALRLGALLDLEDGEAGKAVAALRRADAIAPGDIQTLAVLSRALALAGDPGEARVAEARLAAVRREAESLEPLLKDVLRTPEDADLRFRIGATLLRMGRTADARHWLVSAVAFDPGHAAAAAALAALGPAGAPATAADPGGGEGRRAP